ncbi:AAA family ATPase [Azospirillum sp. TSO22-1]|uniref:AAA family ATPase n=1 Tax=Azospirillum sp. TSO22-1 TaxID=716789 RepID=UPI000D64E8EE|nr:AAA family ATPase [Azospirillum sp. TSO22-1]
MSETETAFRFLLQNGTQPFRPSTCFIVADPKVMDRKIWSLELDRPKDAEWFFQIDDIKDWMLHSAEPVRKMYYDRRDPRTPFRELDRDEVFREYLRKILDKLPVEYRQRRKYALMPSIGDDKTRTRYRDALEAALPDVTIIPEPEMVAEYFRLLKRTLKLESGANNVILVIDVGASTANMTLVVSRRDQAIVDVDTTGAQRDQRIRALRGDSVDHAGRWVDKQLAQALGVLEPRADKDLESRDRVLRAIERAKVSASQTGKDAPVEISPGDASMVITQKMLRSVSKTLAGSLGQLFQRLCERLYNNHTNTDYARRISKARLSEREVNGPGDAYRLIDFILLAGGTSLLPEFEEAILSAFFPDRHRPKVLRVGTSFAIAAAAGGLAHRLHNYAPPRLRDSDEQGGAVVKPALESTLPYPLLIGIKQTAESEEQFTILDPNDPFIDDGGMRPIEGLPPLAAGSRPKMRLVPGGAAGVEARKGRNFKALEVLQSPGKMSVHWDPVRQRATVHSDQVRDTKSTLWIDAAPHRKREEAALNPFDGDLKPSTLAVDQAEDVVLDLGMSKIVALTADRGWVSAEELERVVKDGLDEEQLIPADNQPKEAPIIVEVGSQGLQDDRSEPWSDLETTDRPSISHGAVEEERAVDVEKGDQDGDVPDEESSVGPERPASTAPAGGPDPRQDRGSDWGTRIPDAQFSYALEKLRDSLKSAAPHQRFDDIIVVLLALAVRPIVLLAGPPGCGKSTLVRTIARILGMESGKTFHEVAVQAHWENDSPLFAEKGLLFRLLEDQSQSHIVLFDEFNLTRPEYYLSRMFYALDGGRGAMTPDTRIAPCRVLGTMNIDDSSRPPSPKVIDRCFLLELEQVDWDAESPVGLPDFGSIQPLSGLPVATVDGATTDPRINEVLQALHKAVFEHDLRHDLLPSRRALSDIRALLGLHHRLDLKGKDLLSRDDLVDRVLASRVLVKLSGAFDQVQPALDALDKAVDGMEELRRTRRRLKLARQQSRLGFVSPWQ